MNKEAKESSIIEISEENFKNLIYEVRGQQVMLDTDLAQIYGYSTKAFNQQVKNNIEKFDADFMFQLTKNEQDEILRSKFLTLEQGKFSKYLPYAFTEQGIYMLMTVLKGDLATRQSKALIRTFKKMKDYIVQNQPLLGQREILQLSLQTAQNSSEISTIRETMAALDEKVVAIANSMNSMVKKSEIGKVMMDFAGNVETNGWLILNGQFVESDMAYKRIYAQAKNSIQLIDNYIGLKTLVLLNDIPSAVKVTIYSDNVGGRLHSAEYNDFKRQYPQIDIEMRSSGGIFHDRYIVLDLGTPTEAIYHCGASSKDGGNRVMSIEKVNDVNIYRPIIQGLASNSLLVLP